MKSTTTLTKSYTQLFCHKIVCGNWRQQQKLIIIVRSICQNMPKKPSWKLCRAPKKKLTKQICRLWKRFDCAADVPLNGLLLLSFIQCGANLRWRPWIFHSLRATHTSLLCAAFLSFSCARFEREKVHYFSHAHIAHAAANRKKEESLKHLHNVRRSSSSTSVPFVQRCL